MRNISRWKLWLRVRIALLEAHLSTIIWKNITSGSRLGIQETSYACCRLSREIILSPRLRVSRRSRARLRLPRAHRGALMAAINIQYRLIAIVSREIDPRARERKRERVRWRPDRRGRRDVIVLNRRDHNLRLLDSALRESRTSKKQTQANRLGEDREETLARLHACTLISAELKCAIRRADSPRLSPDKQRAAVAHCGTEQHASSSHDVN